MGRPSPGSAPGPAPDPVPVLSAAPGGLRQGRAEAGAQRGAGGAAEEAQRCGERVGRRAGQRNFQAGFGVLEIGRAVIAVPDTQGISPPCVRAELARLPGLFTIKIDLKKQDNQHIHTIS